jgi:hypothetical protein
MHVEWKTKESFMIQYCHFWTEQCHDFFRGSHGWPHGPPGMTESMYQFECRRDGRGIGSTETKLEQPVDPGTGQTNNSIRTTQQLLRGPGRILVLSGPHQDSDQFGVAELFGTAP